MTAGHVGWARAVRALSPAVDGLAASFDRGAAEAAGLRGWFRPEEEEALTLWFARFLTARAALWQVIGEVRAALPGDPTRASSDEEWRAIVPGYAAACLLVRLDRSLVEQLATDGLVQRKLNEGSPEHRIPRKQYTAVFDSLSSPRQALELLGAAHALRRRGAVARQRATFAVLEAGGRAVSELRGRRPPRVDAGVLERIRALLEPGDVLVTRHERALTNLFLPGFWPHAALYVGTAADRARLAVEVDEARAARWSGERCVLEALKDGVLFRPLEQTLAVDTVAVLRPRLPERDLATALARAAAHEGKPYNFDFDFLRSDRLVCTEVVYRAFDGLGGLSVPLRRRAGRPTLSAEDLLDLALDSDCAALEPLAAFGLPGREGELVAGGDLAAALAASYRGG